MFLRFPLLFVFLVGLAFGPVRIEVTCGKARVAAGCGACCHAAGAECCAAAERSGGAPVSAQIGAGSQDLKLAAFSGRVFLGFVPVVAAEPPAVARRLAAQQPVRSRLTASCILLV